MSSPPDCYAHELLHASPEAIDRYRYYVTKSLDAHLAELPFHPKSWLHLLADYSEKDKTNPYEWIRLANGIVLPASLQDSLTTYCILEETPPRRLRESAAYDWSRTAKLLDREQDDTLTTLLASYKHALNGEPDPEKSKYIGILLQCFLKQVYVNKLYGNVMLRFYENPSRLANRQDHLAALKHVHELGEIMLLPSTLNRITGVSDSDKQMINALGASISGLLHEIATMLALSDYFSSHNIPAWVLPTGWVLEKTIRYDDGQLKYPGLDIVLYRPDTKQVRGVQCGLTKIVRPEHKNHGVVVVNAADILSLRGRLIDAALYIGALLLAKYGVDLTECWVAPKSRKLIVPANRQPKKMTEGKLMVKATRQAIGQILNEQAPEFASA